MQDKVNNPNHYTQGSVECIEAIESSMSKDEFLGFLKGNIIKYLWRYRHKNGAEDLAKSQFYVIKLIEVYKDAKRKWRILWG